MRFTAALAVLSAAGIVAAQTSTSAAASSPTGSSECDAQNIVDACKDGIQEQIDKCEANDWICLCDNYTNLLTCYNNCPDSSDRSPVDSNKTSYCNAAAPLKSSSAAAAATEAKTSAPATSATDASATGSSTASSTQSAASAFNTGAASAIAAPAGGLFAVLLGVAGLL